MAEQGDIEHTLVMSDTSGTETGSKSGSLRSDIVIEGSHKTIETVDLNADSSLEFRRTLEKSGKRALFRKQKELLDTFLSHGAIDRRQYEKSLTCMAEKMGIALNEEKADT